MDTLARPIHWPPFVWLGEEARQRIGLFLPNTKLGRCMLVYGYAILKRISRMFLHYYSQRDSVLVGILAMFLRKLHIFIVHIFSAFGSM